MGHRQRTFRSCRGVRSVQYSAAQLTPIQEAYAPGASCTVRTTALSRLRRRATFASRPFGFDPLRLPVSRPAGARKSVVEGKSGAVRVDLGVRRVLHTTIPTSTKISSREL